MQVWNKRMYLRQETVRVLNKLQNKQKKKMKDIFMIIYTKIKY